MSEQIFLQGKLLGIEPFVLAPVGERGDAVLAGRSHWVTLLMEVLPRALLAHLGLSPMLLGSSGGGGFMAVLTQENMAPAEEFLRAAAAEAASLSGGRLRLVWAHTANLGDWPAIRKRLGEELARRQGTLPEAASADFFAPLDPGEIENQAEYFAGFAARIRAAELLGWSPETPARVLSGEGKFTWKIGSGYDAIPLARHTALSDDGFGPADLAVLAGRASGHPAWGVLRGDIDGFGIRLRRVQTIEDHIQLSVLFKQFFAGELEVACSMPEFWRKATILYSGGDDFAVYGSWDALLLLARELQRLFQKFAEAQLKDLPGPEGKTISMALEVAPETGSPFAFVYEEAGRNLAAAKCADKDCIHIFGKTVEWGQLTHAAGLKEMLLRMVREFDCPPAFLEELGGFYRVKPSATRPDRPWRYHRRLGVVLGSHKDRELQKLQNSLITDVIGGSANQVKLRPTGLVAVSWARMLMETRG
ncbi:MAG: hypothetical protein FJW39_20045 [Acidobacteria bacterium]|nr:hypothetical protein [Acidobacteriota bacterium]